MPFFLCIVAFLSSLPPPCMGARDITFQRHRMERNGSRNNDGLRIAKMQPHQFQSATAPVSEHKNATPGRPWWDLGGFWIGDDGRADDLTDADLSRPQNSQWDPGQKPVAEHWLDVDVPRPETPRLPEADVLRPETPRLPEADVLRPLWKPLPTIPPRPRPEQAHVHTPANASGVAAAPHGTWPFGEEITLVGLTYNVEANGQFADAARSFNEILHEDPSANVAVVCTQEAETPGFAHALESHLHEPWRLLGSRRNKGFTRSPHKQNHQELSVLVKLPTDGKTQNWHLDDARSQSKGMQGKHVCYKDSNTDAAVCADLSKVRTSLAGKGGVYGWIQFTSEGTSTSVKPVRLMVACAHLDASDNSIRRENVKAILDTAMSKHADASDSNQVIALEGAKSDMSDVKLADVLQNYGPSDMSDLGDVTLADVIESYEAINVNPNGADVAVILGDLNYRIDPMMIDNVTDVEKIVALIRDHIVGLPTELKKGDSIERSYLMRQNPDGLGFKCNAVGTHPPTYKADVAHSSTARDACEVVREVHAVLSMNRARGKKPVDFQKSPSIWEELEERINQCYLGSHEDVNEWPRKKGDLQLGWLDRLCWRTYSETRFVVKEDVSFSELQTHRIQNFEWNDAPVAKQGKRFKFAQKLGLGRAPERQDTHPSDHFPMLVKLTIGAPKIESPVPPPRKGKGGRKLEKLYHF